MMYYIDEAVNYLKDKRIICWGLGKYYKDTMVPFFKKHKLEANIEYLVDKNESVLSKQTDLSDNIKKISVDSIERVVDSNTILVYTAKSYNEMEEYVLSNPKLKELKTIPSYVLGGLYLDDNLLLDDAFFEGKMKEKSVERIPRIINTFWFSNDPIPEKYQDCMKSWKKFCPDYEIRIWSLNDYNSEGCRFFDEAISVKNWSIASDYSRIDVIYRYGGIYMDMDVEVIKPLDDLIRNEAYLGFESMQHVDCGSGFGAEQGNRIFGEIRNEYLDKPFILEDKTYNIKEICPVVYTEALKKQGLVSNGKYQKVDNITVYPFECLSAKSFETGIIYKTNNTYTIHHHGGTWLSNENKEVIKKRYADVNHWLKVFSDKGE